MTVNSGLLHETYSMYYKDPIVDVFYDSYQAVLVDSFKHDAGSQPRTLFNLVLDSVNTPQVFAVLSVNNKSEPRIYYFTTQPKYQYDSVAVLRMVTVQFPAEPFNVAQKTRVLSVENTTKYFEEHPDALFVPTVADDVVDSEELTVRNMMWVPTFLVPDLLLPQGYAPSAFWQIGITKLQESEKMDDCEIFVDWMRVTVTAITMRVTNTRSSESFAILHSSLVVPIMDEELFENLNAIVNKDIPGRFNQGMGFNNAILKLADAVAANMTKSVSLVKEQS